MPQIHEVRAQDGTIAYVVKGADSPSATEFVTPSEANLQVGFIVKEAGFTIPNHDHKPVERHIVGTAEVLFVRKGRCEITFFDSGRKPVETAEVETGDIVVLLAGGHGFHMLEDTVFVEVKQGPYPGIDEKDQF
jgi:hypothetical protein